MITTGELKSTYSPEMALVILVCRIYLKTAEPNELSRYLGENKMDWTLFERIITVHQVRPFIYKVLSAHNTGIDNGVMTRLRNNCFGIAKSNLQNLEELSRLTRLFSENGIQNIPYKGVVLSYLLFGDFISRETVDIDFLVHPADFSSAHRLLEADGYVSKYYNPDFERQFLRTSHELMFRKSTPAGDFKAEIHWAVTNHMMNIPLSEDVVFQNPMTVTLAGNDIRTFNITNHLLVLIVHHGVNDVWRTLRHALDLCLLLDKYRQDINWDTLIRDTIQFRIRHTTEAGCSLARDVFGIDLPTQYIPVQRQQSVLHNLLTFPAIRKQKLNWQNLQQQLYLRDSFTDKVRLVLSYIYTGVTPNTRDMEAFPLPRNAYILYYVIKPFRILFRMKK